MEKLAVFARFEAVSDRGWGLAQRGGLLSQYTVYQFFVWSTGNMGTNLVEGDDRYGKADALLFLLTARGSARGTTRWWVVPNAPEKWVDHSAFGKKWSAGGYQIEEEKSKKLEAAPVKMGLR